MLAHTKVRWIVLGCLCLGWAAVAGATGARKNRRKLNGSQRIEAGRLVKIVDAVADGKFGGGDAWLKWDGHFLRAPDGKTYVPYTLVIDEAPGAFKSVSMYVRVANHGEDSRAGKRRRAARKGSVGYDPGSVPVSVPERLFARPGEPVAGENSAMLQLAQRGEQGEATYPFEDVQFIDLATSGMREPYLIRRALAVPSGDYDLYVSVRESRINGKTIPHAKSAALKRHLVVPSFTGDGLRTSSIIVADQVITLATPYPARTQIEHPYALGAGEIVPARDTILAPGDMLSVVFFVYNLAADEHQKPDATITYAFYEHSGASEALFQRTAPQQYNAGTLPPRFNLQAFGNQLPVSQAVALNEFPEGAYRLEIRTRDNLADATIVDNLQFVVMDRHAKGN